MATTYRIQFNNVEEQAIECTLTDETGDLDIIDIEGAEDAVRIVSQDNDESKYSPIKAKKCVIKFLNSQTVNFRTFASGEDNKWLVTVKINSLTVFIGHLEQGDIQEPFQYQENQIVTLTATDGLGILKSHRLEDVFNVWSATPCGLNENRIIDYVASCLASTGLELTINVINNLREQDNDDTTDTTTYGNIYATLYLSLRTFEDGQVGKYMTCYDILEKILGHDCVCFQEKGQWWIVRVTEWRQDFNMIKTVFDFDGTALSFEALNYEKGLGLKDLAGTPFGTPDAAAYFSQDKTMRSLERPVKSVSLEYKYENPIEILANATLQRGDFIADLPDELSPDGITLTAKSFNTDCWEYKKDVPPTTQDSTEYTKVLYSGGQEVERFIHMEPTVGTPFYYLASLQNIPVSYFDKISFGMSVRYSDDVSGTGLFLKTQAQLRLTADDGTFWTCHVSVPGTLAPEPGKFWVQAPDGNWTTNQEFLIWEDDADVVDFSQWNSLTFDCPPAPRSGTIEVILTNSNDPDVRSKDFSSLDFKIIPYINGSFGIFNSQSDTSTRDGVYFTSIEDDVFISNAPRAIFKGALLKFNGTNFVPVDLFYEGQQYDQTTGPDHLATYGELRVRAYHNQFRNGDEIVKANCQGLGEGVTDANGLDDHPGLIHRYFLKDLEPTTLVRAFLLVSQDVDLRNCEWTGTLIKTFDTDIGFVTDTYTFSYGAPGTTGGGGGVAGGGSSASIRFAVAGEDDIAGEDRAFDQNGFQFQIFDDPAGATTLALSPSSSLIKSELHAAGPLDVTAYVALTSDTITPAARVEITAQHTGVNAVQIILDSNTQKTSLQANGVQFIGYGAGTATFDASGNITSVSDERLKDIQGNYEDSIEEIMKITPIVYKWNKKSINDTEGTYIGFSAQNIQEALGENAVGKNANGYLSIQDRAIIATLVNAVKQLQKEVDDLKSKINAGN